jgi:quinone-modifying oxidoreductase, subunit QmoC
MGVLRQMCIEHYAIPPILARMVGDYRFLPLLIALPVVLLLLALKVTGRLAIPEGEIIYAKMFPWYTIDVIFIGAAAFAVFVLAQGVLRYWNDINADPWKVKLKGSVVSQLVPTLTQIVTHEKFKLCETTFARSVNHLLVFFGFVFLGMVTAWAFVLEWVFHQPGPYFLFSPIKILAMVGTALLLYGIYQVIVARQANTEKAGYGTYYDWQLIWMIVAVGVTGLGSWAFRLLGIKLLAYPTYFLHLVAVFFLFFYLPYTKLAHLVYRSVAMLYARMADRGF